jgi:hypothetical protein
MHLGSSLVFAVTQTSLRKWWAFVGCGILTGDFPATFYLAAAPTGAQVPLSEMYLTGTLCGVGAGFILNAMLGKREAS